jgi:hypothetical protein
LLFSHLLHLLDREFTIMFILVANVAVTVWMITVSVKYWLSCHNSNFYLSVPDAYPLGGWFPFTNCWWSGACLSHRGLFQLVRDAYV